MLTNLRLLAWLALGLVVFGEIGAMLVGVWVNLLIVALVPVLWQVLDQSWESD